MIRQHPAFGAFFLFCGLLCLVVPLAFAQSAGSPAVPLQAPASQAPLHVESNVVLVPVFVYDPSRMEKAAQEELPCARATLVAFFKLLPKEPYLPKDCDVTEVHDITAKDLRLFQDGVEQEITSFDDASWRTVVRDNLGWHLEASDTPRGIWSLSELSPLKKVPFLSEEFHILGYVPNNAKPGCHHIKVEVHRPNLLVFAKDQYCTGQTPTDLLAGTNRGKELERVLASNKRGKIPLTLQAAALFTNNQTARVDISLRFPWSDLFRKWDTSNWTLYARIEVLGVLRAKDGTIAARFSDVLYPSYWPTFDQGGAKFISWAKGTSQLSGATQKLLSKSTAGMDAGSSSDSDLLALTFPNAAGAVRPDETAIQVALNSSDPFWIPTRYETQIDVPPGEYNLEVVLSDEWQTGRAEMPLTIDTNEGKQLAISSLVLCNRLRDAAVAAKEAAAAKFAPLYVPLVSDGITFTPTGDTKLEKGEPLFAYFEVNEPLLGQQPAPTVEAHMRILDAGTGEVVADLAHVKLAPYVRSGSSLIPLARKIPITQLPAGAYRLEVQATDSIGQSTPWRAATFSVN